MFPRNLQPELMDDPAIDPAEHRRALRGLARINALSRAGAGLWRPVHRLLQGRQTASLLDIAVGSGDVLIDVARRASSAGVTLDLHAVDISPEALRATAERAESAGLTVATRERNAVRDGLGLPDASVGVVMCSLFLHHLREQEVVGLLREAARVARLGVVVSDLRRCRAGVLAANLAGRTLTRSRIVRVDAVRSVQGAFAVAEMKSMADAAGLAGASVVPAWPLRMMLTWEKKHR